VELPATASTVNLSIATLEDERFVQKIAAALNAHGIAADTLGFEIAEALCTQRRAQVDVFITQCDKARCLGGDRDFSFDSQVLPLLRSKRAAAEDRPEAHLIRAQGQVLPSAGGRRRAAAR